MLKGLQKVHVIMKANKLKTSVRRFEFSISPSPQYVFTRLRCQEVFLCLYAFSKLGGRESYVS